MSKKNYLLTMATATARELLKSDKKVLPVKNWGDGNTLFVSADETAIYFTQKIDVEGTEIFIGASK